MRIGILGGTFNPIHNGHIRLAEGARRRLKLDKVIFVPANIPPHKLTKGLLSASERYKMVRMAIKGYPGFTVSKYEITRHGKSYSVRTLGYFRKKFGQGAKIFFLAGSDSLPQLGTWKSLDRIIGLSDFVVISRPRFRICKSEGIRTISISTPDISSTDIRRRIKRGISAKGMLPPDVRAYISKKGFYR